MIKKGVFFVLADLQSDSTEYQDLKSASSPFFALQMLIFNTVGLQIRPNGAG